LERASDDWKEVLQRVTRRLEWQQVHEFLARAESRLRLAKGQDQRLLNAVTRVATATALETRLLREAAQGVGLRWVQQFLDGAEGALRSATALDMGAFWVTTAALPPRGWMSERQTTCLSLLDRHLKHASGRKRTSRRILADLLGQFGFLPDGLKDPERWVEKRLERVNSETRMPLMSSYNGYHLLHNEAKAPCTGACKLRRSVLAAGTRRSQNEDRLFLGGPPRFVKSRVTKPSRRGSRE
jgi:hypothetical protein